MIQDEIEILNKFFAKPVNKRCDGTPAQKRQKAWQNYKKQKRHRRTNAQMKRQR